MYLAKLLNIVDNFLLPLAQAAGIFLLILGVMWLIYALYEASRRESWRKLTKIDDWDFDITKFLKLLTLLGFVVGIFSILAGVAGLILDVPPSIAYKTFDDSRNLFTSIFLIVLGILTFMKPLNDLPIASVLGILAGTAICIIIALFIPESAVEWIGKYINPRIILLIVFLLIFTIVAVTVKFYTAGLMMISKIISWPPLAFIVAIFCFVQFFALFVLGISIV